MRTVRIPALTALLDAWSKSCSLHQPMRCAAPCATAAGHRDAVGAEIRSLLDEAQIESAAGSSVVAPFTLRAGILSRPTLGYGCPVARDPACYRVSPASPCWIAAACSSIAAGSSPFSAAAIALSNCSSVATPINAVLMAGCEMT